MSSGVERLLGKDFSPGVGCMLGMAPLGEWIASWCGHPDAAGIAMLAANRWGVCGLPQAIDKHVKIGSLSCLCLEDRAAGSQARFYADAEGMNADARGWARVRHGAARLNPADPDEQYWRVGPCPIRVHRRPSGCICVRCLLA